MQNPDVPVDAHPDGIAAQYPDGDDKNRDHTVVPPDTFDEKGRTNPKYMTDRALLEEAVTTGRAMQDAVEQIVGQVGEAMNSPMLGGMLKMFGRR